MGRQVQAGQQMTVARVPRYGVHVQTVSDTPVARAVEEIRLVGHAILDGGYDRAMIVAFSEAFDRALAATHDQYGGRDALAVIDEHHTIRAPLAQDRLFLTLLQNAAVLAVCHALIGDYVILNQQNGIVNPPLGAWYNQQAYHRDLPYQHFTSSRPLAVNALFCLDDFTAENGAILVLPGSHKEEAFPSDLTVMGLERQIVAPAGSFIILDSMLFHSGASNRSDRPRRAINHLYTIPLIRQQIDLLAMLGNDFTSKPNERRLLGYDVQTAKSVDEYYAERQIRANAKAVRSPKY